MSGLALVTGIAGQDGSYLAEHLLDRGSEVHGIVRRQSVAENQDTRIAHLEGRVQLHYGDLLDPTSLARIVDELHPDEIYNLAAMSHVRISFEVPAYTIQANSASVLTLLECLRTQVPEARFYQASSSEMFGNCADADGFQRIGTPMEPVSPYGCAKLLAYSMVRHYRRAYGLFATNGILFNHESPRRGSNFVTNKIVKGAVRIRKGLQRQLPLGNLDVRRDWGHSKDYTRAMIRMLEQPEPGDFVISAMENHSVRELCELVFGKLDLDYRDFVVQEERHLRPEELQSLRGDSSEARRVLGWEPEYTFESMIDEMIEHWERTLSEARA